ncbi:hypothetical protein JI752_016495 [Lysobacter sp. MMG2]|uniref:hypothetical protein n=1 Tax=Lysobacter sp. MMG2 TaxID=2801338 RepID=UPI001C220D79|nr:hypothetical protein [Lysobacter sp. MMG2]MBU8977749.1 hypothetical protein [Lysobacter sp. MMG2]
MKTFAKFLGVVVLMIGAFALGFVAAPPGKSSRLGEQVQFVQADRAVQSIATFREVQDYLEKGCSLSATRLVAEQIELNMMLLAEHVRDYPDGVFVGMLKKRDPELLNRIRSQRVDWGRTYVVPECTSNASGSG